MPWARIDDMLPVHPKIRTLSDSAFRLYISAICWSNLNSTDGHIPSKHLRFISDVRRPHQCVEQLLEAGLWETAPEGWRIHDYLEYQPSAEKVRRERESKQQRQERWRSKRDASHDASPEPSQDASSRARPHPIPSPDGSVGDPSSARTHSDVILIRATQQAITDRTGSRVTDDEALRIATQIMGSENVRDRAAYVSAAINRDKHPRRFIPVKLPPPPPRLVRNDDQEEVNERGRAAAKAALAQLTGNDQNGDRPWTANNSRPPSGGQ